VSINNVSTHFTHVNHCGSLAFAPMLREAEPAAATAGAYLEAPRAGVPSHRLLLDRGSEKVKPFNYRVSYRIPIGVLTQDKRRGRDAASGRTRSLPLVILGDVDPQEKAVRQGTTGELARYVREGGG